VRFILPKEDHFFDYLEQQAALAHEGALALAKLDSDPVAEVKDAVHAIEKRGDKVSHELEDALGKTFVTPIDREDLHKTASDASNKQIALLGKTTALLAETVPCLRSNDYTKIRDAIRQMKIFEKEGDTIYRATMREMFADASLDARSLIREKEVLEILENAIDTCEDVGEFLANLAVKNG